jgi:hypothetical protein
MPYTYTVKAMLHDDEGVGDIYQWMRVSTIKEVMELHPHLKALGKCALHRLVTVRGPDGTITKHRRFKKATTVYVERVETVDEEDSEYYSDE